MKRTMILAMVAFVLCSVVAYGQMDITSPGDPVVGYPNDDDWPPAETPPLVIDNDASTKYLHFKGGSQATGFDVTPSTPGTIAGGMSFTTANDAGGRDPVEFALYGSNVSISEGFELIASGEIVDFNQENEWPRFTKNSTPIRFLNDTAYDHYRVLITAVRDPGQGYMQIAEIEIIAQPLTGWSPDVYAGRDRLFKLPGKLEIDDAVISDFDSEAEDLSFSWLLVDGPTEIDFEGTQGELIPSIVFPEGASGTYTFRLDAFDESLNDANDFVIVRLWDSETENKFLAHWKFNEGTGAIANDSVGADNDVATFGSLPTGQIPSWGTGWIPSDGADNNAIDFTNLGYAEVIAADSNDLADGPQWQITIAAWMNATDWDGNRRVIQKGASDNQYRILAEWGDFKFDLSGVGTLTSPLPPAGLWHHVAATYDNDMMRAYIDGIEVASTEAHGLINMTDDPISIGRKGSTATVDGDYFLGLIDDLRIYNYALTEAEILELVAMGQNAAPGIVSIDAPEELILSIVDYIDIDVTAIDMNDDAINYEWTSSKPNDTTFDPADGPDTRVRFTGPGTYTLRLSINDGYYGLDGEIFREVTVEVSNPGCAETLAAGFSIAGDLNNDCKVDLADIAIIAANWAECINPQEDQCQNPWAELAL